MQGRSGVSHSPPFCSRQVYFTTRSQSFPTGYNPCLEPLMLRLTVTTSMDGGLTYYYETLYYAF